MYKIILLLFTIICFQNLHAQDDYLEIISKKTCECIQEKKDANKEISSAELGACLFKNSTDYKVQLMKDYNLDITALSGDNAERFGEIVGANMLFVCPDLLAEFADDEPQVNSITGKITDIIDKTNVLLEITTPEGKRQKFYWLTFIETDFDIQQSYKNLKDKEVTIEYIEQEIFDPKIQEYRTFGVISSLKVN